jgi:hypothetical protein
MASRWDRFPRRGPTRSAHLLPITPRCHVTVQYSLALLALLFHSKHRRRRTFGGPRIPLSRAHAFLQRPRRHHPRVACSSFSPACCLLLMGWMDERIPTPRIPSSHTVARSGKPGYQMQIASRVLFTSDLWMQSYHSFHYTGNDPQSVDARGLRHQLAWPKCADDPQFRLMLVAIIECVSSDLSILPSFTLSSGLFPAQWN